MKLRIFSLLLSLMAVGSQLMANGPLKKPLTFIESDSIVVWGEDRSDFRTTALGVAPELKARKIAVEDADLKKYKKEAAAWKKTVLPTLNVLGGVGKEGDASQVLSTADMLNKAGKLFLLSGEASYLDVVERASLNSLMNILSPGELSFEKHIAAQTMMNVSSMIYATDDVGLYVNFYINSSTRIKAGKLNFVIDQLTAMPHSKRVKLRIGGLRKGQQPIVLRLRMPSWAYGTMDKKMPFAFAGTSDKLPSVYVNGREEFYHMENGYLVINRLWNSGDEVFFDFPFDVRFLYSSDKGRNDESRFALQRGPLVYGLTEPCDHMVDVEQAKFVEKTEANGFAHSVLAGEVKFTDGKTTSLEAQPVMDGVKQLWLENAKTSLHRK